LISIITPLFDSSNTLPLCVYLELISVFGCSLFVLLYYDHQGTTNKKKKEGTTIKTSALIEIMYAKKKKKSLY
jgi:hypothetical protein